MELSLCWQAVHRPGAVGAEPRKHPLARGERITDWQDEPSGFEGSLVPNCLRGAVDRQDRDLQLPSR